MVDFWIEKPGQPRQRIRKLAPVTTRRDALEYERRLRTELLLAPPAEKEAPTLAEFSQEFLRNYAATCNRPVERDNKKRTFRDHLLPAMGKLRLDEIDRRVIDAFKAMQLGKKLHPNTVNHHLATLGRALHIAQEWGVLDHVPKLVMLKLPPAEFDFFDLAEAERLVAANEGYDRTIVLTLLRTGLRVGEFVALKWAVVDLKAGRLFVRAAFCEKLEGAPKGNKTREVALASDVVAALEKHPRTSGPYVFCKWNGKPYTRHHISTIVERACRKAGLRELGPHALRHSFASHLVVRGVPIKVVQELMGHADLRMTLRYAHLSPGVHRQAVEVLTQPASATALGTIWATPRVPAEGGSEPPSNPPNLLRN